jgi:hypothetical protein
LSRRAGLPSPIPEIAKNSIAVIEKLPIEAKTALFSPAVKAKV